MQRCKYNALSSTIYSRCLDVVHTNATYLEGNFKDWLDKLWFNQYIVISIIQIHPVEVTCSFYHLLGVKIQECQNYSLLGTLRHKELHALNFCTLRVLNNENFCNNYYNNRHYDVPKRCVLAYDGVSHLNQLSLHQHLQVPKEEFKTQNCIRDAQLENHPLVPDTLVCT